MTMFDYEAFESRVEEFWRSYNHQTLLHTTVFDGFFDDTLLDEINREIDEENFVGYSCN